MKALGSLTSGCCIPTLGSIYPILKELTRHGYAEVREDRQLKGAQKRRVYTLTPAGLEAYRVALEAWRSSMPYIYRAIGGAASGSVQEESVPCPGEKS